MWGDMTRKRSPIDDLFRQAEAIIHDRPSGSLSFSVFSKLFCPARAPDAPASARTSSSSSHRASGSTIYASSPPHFLRTNRASSATAQPSCTSANARSIAVSFASFNRSNIVSRRAPTQPKQNQRPSFASFRCFYHSAGRGECHA